MMSNVEQNHTNRKTHRRTRITVKIGGEKMSRSRAGERWTDKEVKMLRELYNQGLTDDQIAVKLRRSKKAIKVKRVKEGLVEKYSCKRKNHNGYIELYKPEHHRARGNGYVFEHIVVAENKIGRKIKENECVHHKDGDATNNSPENLEVMTIAEHSSKHSKGRKTGEYLTCPICGNKFYVKPSHVKDRKTCSQECAAKLFRKYYTGKPKDYKPTKEMNNSA